MVQVDVQMGAYGTIIGISTIHVDAQIGAYGIIVVELNCSTCACR
jgi:hypothetical protein